MKSRRMSLAGHVARVGGTGKHIEPERKRPLGRLRHKWEDNIQMHCREMDGVV
jgi:hypothetical protein